MFRLSASIRKRNFIVVDVLAHEVRSYQNQRFRPFRPLFYVATRFREEQSHQTRSLLFIMPLSRHFSNIHASQELHEQKFRQDEERQQRSTGGGPSNRLKYLLFGSVFGALAVGALAYKFLHPASLEKLIAKKAINAFNTALGFDARVRIYLALPEYVIPVDFLSLEGHGSSFLESDQSKLLNMWADVVLRADDLSESSMLLQAKTQMRQALLGELLQQNSKNLQTNDMKAWRAHNSSHPQSIVKEFNAQWSQLGITLSELRKILPRCIERDLLQERLLSGLKWLPAELLDENIPSGDMQEDGASQLEPCNLVSRLLVPAIAFFPGPADALVLYLTTGSTASDSGDQQKALEALLHDLPLDGHHGSDPKVSKKKISEALSTLKRRFDEIESDSPCDIGSAIQKYILREALGKAISAVLKSHQSAETSPNGQNRPSPYDLYRSAVQTHLTAPLQQDARIPRDLVDQVGTVFMALPAYTQASVLLRAILQPTNYQFSGSSSMQKETASAMRELEPQNTSSQAVLVRDIIAAGGIVAIKLAQMLAENPHIPSDYRLLFSDMRDKNEPMSALKFWKQLPLTLRNKIALVGPCLGTGSVKQVHRCILSCSNLVSKSNASSSMSWNSRPDQVANGAVLATTSRFLAEDSYGAAVHQDPAGPAEVAVAVLRAGVEHEALASLDALSQSKDVGPFAARLRSLIFGELNLFSEGEALQAFAATALGRHARFQVVPVWHHSPRALILGLAEGPTMAAALSPELQVHRRVARTVLDSNGQSSVDDESVLEKKQQLSLLQELTWTKELLVEYHRIVFQVLLQDGLIHSDVHLGNAVRVRLADRSPRMSSSRSLSSKSLPEPPSRIFGQPRNASDRFGNFGLALFDIGQVERVSQAEAVALLWTLAALSTTRRRYLLRNISLSHLCAVSRLQEHKQATSRNQEIMAQLLSRSFDEAVRPIDDLQGGPLRLPDKKEAYLRFLAACEKNGVELCQGAFAMAKLLDAIDSQQSELELPEVVNESIEHFLLQNMTWGELVHISFRSLRRPWQ